MSVRPDLVACWLYRIDPDAGLQVLLIHRAPDRIYPGLWQCVTGRLEPDERIVDGARREVIEETGFGPGDLEAFFDTDLVNWFHEPTADTIRCEAVFAARVRPDAEVRLSSEHDAVQWLGPDEARRLVAWAAYRRAIEFLEWLVANPDLAAPYRLSGPA